MGPIKAGGSSRPLGLEGVRNPQNTTVVQSEHTEHYSKVPSTAPSIGSLWQWIITSSGACLGQHLGHIVNNGQQSAVLHASVFFFGSTINSVFVPI